MSIGSVMHGLPSVVTTPLYLEVRSGMIILSLTLFINASISSLVNAVLNNKKYLYEPTVGWLSSSLPSLTGASGSHLNSSNSRFSA